VRGDTHHDEDSPRWMKMTRELSIQSQKLNGISAA